MLMYSVSWIMSKLMVNILSERACLLTYTPNADTH